MCKICPLKSCLKGNEGLRYNGAKIDEKVMRELTVRYIAFGTSCHIEKLFRLPDNKYEMDVGNCKSSVPISPENSIFLCTYTYIC